jgi:toxin YoeB
MIYTIEFSKDAEKIVAKYKKSNPSAYKKLSLLLNEIAVQPRTGTGHPEPLTKGNEVTYSRRISAKDRIIYDVYDDTVIVFVISVGGHYKDK